MKDLREALERLAREHPSVRRAHGDAIPVTERRLIDGMLEQTLGAAGCGTSVPKWFIRERTLVVILADSAAYAAARFLTRELTKTLRNLGYPGGAQDVRFRTARPDVSVHGLVPVAAPGRNSAPGINEAEPPERTRSATGAQALREAASQQSDQHLAAALARLARHVDPQGPA